MKMFAVHYPDVFLSSGRQQEATTHVRELPHPSSLHSGGGCPDEVALLATTAVERAVGERFA